MIKGISVLLFFCSIAFALPSNAASSSDPKPVNRITLKKTDVIGSQELPRIISVISWKKTKPIEQPILHKQLEMAFTPIDIKEFSREIAYRRQMMR